MPERHDRCPRCGDGFHCGINDAQPCACSTLQLDAATLAELPRNAMGKVQKNLLREQHLGLFA